MNKKPIETEKKCNKACLVVTITIVVLINLGVYFYYDEISTGLTYQYDKYFGDELEDLNHSTTMTTLNSNEKDTTRVPEMTTDPTEAAKTTNDPLGDYFNGTFDLEDIENNSSEEGTTTTEVPSSTTTTSTTTKETVLESSGSGDGKFSLSYDDEDYV